MLELAIVDTDILIDAGRGDEKAIAGLEQIESRFQLAVSTVTQMELIVGCRDKRDLHLLDHFLARFEIINLNEAISESSVKLLMDYRLSHGLLIADAIIAATALTLGGPLASKNQRDYQFIDQLNLLPYPNPCP